MYGSDPPDRIRRPLMIQALAYRLQEQALGGLKPATRRLLCSVADDSETCSKIEVDSKRRVKAGAVLIREWQGTKHQVTALKDGFMFRGKRFQSLSKIAGEITGTRWSGPLFFGLKNSRSNYVEPTRPRKLRCAIYTRKSSEEGLEQDFNSQHAQRESGEAFVKSQTG